MSDAESLEERIRAIDPLTPEVESDLQSRRDYLWRRVHTEYEHGQVPRPGHKLQVALASCISAIVVSSIVTFVLDRADSGTHQASSLLSEAAKSSEATIGLPKLRHNQYYLQQTDQTVYCSFTVSKKVDVHFLTDDVRTTWTRPLNPQFVLKSIESSAFSGIGWASPVDKKNWVKAGRPYNPCVGASQDGALSAISTSVDLSVPIGSRTMSVFAGIRRIYTRSFVQNRGTPLNSFTEFNLLADGRINPSGSVSRFPQRCPVMRVHIDKWSTSELCSVGDQLQILEQLMRLPDASLDYRGLLLEAMAHDPNVEEIQFHSSVLRNDDIAFEDPKSGMTVVLSKKNGALIKILFEKIFTGSTGCNCIANNSTPGDISFGAVRVVTLADPRLK